MKHPKYEDLNNCGVYAILNTVNGKRYVGSSILMRKRFVEHRRDLSRGDHHAIALQRAVDKYGIGSFEFTVLAFCNPEDRLRVEQSFMDEKAEYNSSPTAGSVAGLPCREDVKVMLSEKLRGREFSEEHRSRISEALLAKRAEGWSPSEESIKSAADKRRGIKASDETRAKLSAARKGRRTLPIGFRHSEETRRKMAEREPTFLGKTHTDETKAELSKMAKARWENPEYALKQKVFQTNPEALRAKSERAKGNTYALGYKHTDAAKEKLRLAFIGREFSQETRLKMSEAQRRKAPPSAETRKKMGDSRRGDKNGAAILKEYCLTNESGDILRGIPLKLRELTGIHQASMSNLISGKQKTAKGWRILKETNE